MLSFFPRGVLDEILNLIESVSEDFPSYSWLLSATGKVVNWFGNNLWALVVLVAGLLYAAAKEWINKSHK